MRFGIYFHLPFCLQRCTYCDFATEDWEGGRHDRRYLDLLLKEIRERSTYIPHKTPNTLYFGGGTPSLFPPEFIVALLAELANNGFDLGQVEEVTYEINPGTITQQTLEALIAAGVTRFSVGAQSFNDPLLKSVGRKHSAQDTRDTLELLDRNHVTYSFDLLFGIPGQDLPLLQKDLETLRDFRPQHLSAYCLTVPENHILNRNRPSDEVEAQMYEVIESGLRKIGLLRYEISSYAVPGFESKHNLIYWNDHSYWGLGMGAHSYMKEWGPLGIRFWNPPTLESYAKDLEKKWELAEIGAGSILEKTQTSGKRFETLSLHESLTDYCHTALRKMIGLSSEKFANKYSKDVWTKIFPRFTTLLKKSLIEETPEGFQLSTLGKLLCNKVFEELTFLKTDVDVSALDFTHAKHITALS